MKDKDVKILRQEIIQIINEFYFEVVVPDYCPYGYIQTKIEDDDAEILADKVLNHIKLKLDNL